MAAIAGAAIAGGVGLIGDFMSQSGQQSTNAQNLAIAQMQDQFAASQAFQAEQFSEQMSNSAMTRRVADLKNAGLNPYLAISQGGASTPMGVAANPSGNPVMQNPSQAFSQLGSQMTNAIQTGSQIELQQAQTQKALADARNTDSQTDNVLPAQVQNLQAQYGLTQAQAANAGATLRLIQQQTDKAYFDVQSAFNESEIGRIKQQMTAMDYQTLKATQAAIIESTQNAATASRLGLAGLSNVSSAESSPLGRIVAYANMLLQPLSSAAGTAERVSGMVR